MSTMDRGFMYLGAAVGAFGALVYVFFTLAWAKDRLAKRWSIWSIQRSHQGTFRTLRYNLGVKLILPYIMRRFQELQAQRAKAMKDIAKDHTWTDASIVTLREIIRLDHGKTAKRIAADAKAEAEWVKEHGDES